MVCALIGAVTAQYGSTTQVVKSKNEGPLQAAGKTIPTRKFIKTEWGRPSVFVLCRLFDPVL